MRHCHSEAVSEPLAPIRSNQKPIPYGERSLFRPPAPQPLTPIRALLRAATSRERDLLALLPEEVFRQRVAPLGVTRRGILLVNEPEIVRRIFAEETEAYPKNDLFVGALKPLVGDGVFISTGDTWRRQRRMIEPSFSHIHVSRAFQAMSDAAAAIEPVLDQADAAEQPVGLDAVMSHLTADVICRAIFSQSLESEAARQIFADFEIFQSSVANVRVLSLWLGRPWADVPQPKPARQAADRIRAHIAEMLAPRLADRDQAATDLAGEIAAAHDPETGQRFTTQELVDQIGVFFLAGHETTASAVTWALVILAQQPEALARLRDEVGSICGEGDLTLDHVKRLTFTRNVLRETMRLYPPGPFLPRVAVQYVEISGHALRKGGMVMISPWILHRHLDLWEHPDRFDPDRFARDPQPVAGAYIPFGLGPRACIGAAFATIEGTFLLAHLARLYDIEILEADKVQPAARLTIRPARAIRARLRRRHKTAD